MRVTRSEVISGIVSLYKEARYLEIGVSKGITFCSIDAKYKVAVDPKFLFDFKDTFSDKEFTIHHQVTSDEYFGNIIGISQIFDVIYIDGLHTFEQTLRDFINSLNFISSDGVIIIDDVRPYSYISSLRDSSEFKVMKKRLKASEKGWMGDVYKLVFFIQTFFQQLQYRTISNNHGQLVVWPGRRESVPERRVEQIALAPFERVVLERSEFNLMPFTEILEEIRSWKDYRT